MQWNDLLDTLARESRGIIVADTCSLLDVIRAPIRGHGAILAAALAMWEEVKVGTPRFRLVLPSLFAVEWRDNLPTVRDELVRSLRTHRELSALLGQLHLDLLGHPLMVPDVTLYHFEALLEQVCDGLISSAFTMDEDLNAVGRAYRRVAEARPPARKGKQEMKDCTVFEEVLLLGRELRARGFAGRVVFVSSNSEEYGTVGRPIPVIRDDLRASQVMFADTLNFGLHTVTQP